MRDVGGEHDRSLACRVAQVRPDRVHGECALLQRERREHVARDEEPALGEPADGGTADHALEHVAERPAVSSLGRGSEPGDSPRRVRVGERANGPCEHVMALVEDGEVGRGKLAAPMRGRDRAHLHRSARVGAAPSLYEPRGHARVAQPLHRVGEQGVQVSEEHGATAACDLARENDAGAGGFAAARGKLDQDPPRSLGEHRLEPIE